MMAYRSGVMITGGTGFLGHGLVQALLERNVPRICIYSRGEFAQAKMRAAFKDDPRLRWFIGDVRDLQRLERAMESVESVIHAAALKRIEAGAYNPDEFVKTNVIGSMNLIEAARRSGVPKVLLVSSDKAFEPVSPYGQTKALAESLFLTANDTNPYGPRYAVVRYGNVWCSTGSVLPTWLEVAKSGGAIKVTDPEITRFFMWREEAVALVLDTLAHMRGGELAIPELPAYRLGDLVEALGVRAEVVGLGEHEKKHESMGPGKCSADARRMTVDELREAIRRAA
jgi:UDP-N-acetylglucosamine 4,6-dehydratase